MKYFALLVLLTASTAASAEAYMVYQYNQHVRIVLGQGVCLVSGLEGSRASAQRVDGKYIRGCWHYTDNDLNVRIDWENPAKPGDFAVFRAKDFTPVIE